LSNEAPCETLPAGVAEAAVSVSPPAVDVGRRESVRQIRGSSLLLVGRGLSLALNVVVQVATVRILSKEGYGVFAYAMSIAAVAEGLIGLGLPRAVARFVPIFDEQKDHARVLGTIVLAITSTLAGGACAMLLIVGLRGALAGELAKNPAAVVSLAILSALAPLQGFDRLFLELFSVFGKPRAIFVRRFLLGPLLRLAAVLALALRGGGPVALAIGYVAAGIVGLVFYCTMLLGLLRERNVLRPGAWAEMKVPAREIFAFALPLLSTELVILGIQQTDAVMLGQMVGAESVASLRAVVPIARLNQLVIDIFGILFTPIAARMLQRGDRAGIHRLYWSTTTWIAVLSFPIFAATFTLARPMASLLFGPRYADSGGLLAILSAAFYVSAVLGPNGLVLSVFKLVKYSLIVNLAAFVLHLAGNFVMIPAFGAKGAAIATLVTLVVHGVLKQLGLRQARGVKAYDPAAAKPLWVAGAGAAALALLEIFGKPSLPVATAAAVLVTACVLAGTRRALDVEGTFPELMRIPGVRRLIG
jgi:O-antigen/teichoic acid export membrane protein